MAPKRQQKDPSCQIAAGGSPDDAVRYGYSGPGSVLRIFFGMVRFTAILNSLVTILCQLIVLDGGDAAWLQSILRVYVVLFCLLFISSELQLEDYIFCLPACRSWFSRGALYTFISVICFEGELLWQL
jgi:hypothetical protein